MGATSSTVRWCSKSRMQTCRNTTSDHWPTNNQPEVALKHCQPPIMRVVDTCIEWLHKLNVEFQVHLARSGPHISVPTKIIRYLCMTSDRCN